MAPSTSNDNFPTATLRHFHDAEILKEANARENALCHYAFSVECGQKSLLYWSNHVRKQHHELDNDWQIASQLLDAWASLDSALVGAIPSGVMPPKLYDHHPNRRYFKSFPITPQELEACALFAQKMEKTIIHMMIDGLISEQGGYAP